MIRVLPRFTLFPYTSLFQSTVEVIVFTGLVITFVLAAVTAGARFNAVPDTPFTEVVRLQPVTALTTAFTAGAAFAKPITVEVIVFTALVKIFVVAPNNAAAE